MSIPTRVLENGQWVTRWEDPYQILARNRVQQEQKVRPSNHIPTPPTLGILTKTLVRTSVLKWIIPARIRHQSRNDVLFISADFVQLREARGDGTFEHVFVKDDFDSPIRAAKILGLPRELTKPDISTIIKGDPDHWRYDRNGTIKVEESSKTVKREDGVSPNPANLPRRELPPQILVLVLDSCKIIFLHADSAAAEHTPLLTYEMTLPAHPTQLEQLGEHLAVDPKSRAMAVAAHENSFYVYALKSMNDMKEEIKDGAGVCPVKKERKFEVDGTILKMEFLHPASNDIDQVILLLVVAKQERTRLIWYEWNHMMDLRSAQINPNSQSLPSDERMPLLLIPLKAFSAFILVSEERITLYKNLLTRAPGRYIHEPDHQEDSEEPGSSKKNPIWVQWARPMRNEIFRTTDDCIYLCREDGIVHLMDIKHNLEKMLDSTHRAGRLGINISTSFAVVDIGPASDDLLVAGGEASEGGLWYFGARKEPAHLCNRPNWTPMIHSCVAFIPDQGETRSHQQRLFACTGRTKHGSITEIQYGIPALTKLQSVDMGEEIESGVLGIWTFSDESANELYVLVSDPTRTSVMLIRDGYDPELLDDGLGLDLDVRTVAAGKIAGVVVQVTENSLRSMQLPGAADRVSQQRPTFILENERILAACFGISPFESLVALATQQNEEYFLRLGLFDRTFKPAGERTDLPSQPICISLQKSEHILLAIVSCLGGTIQIFSTGRLSARLQLISEYSFQGHFAICDSIALVTCSEEDNGPSGGLLLCGLRNGSLHTLLLEGTGDSFSLHPREAFEIGHTSVTIVTDPNKANRAIIHCDKKLCALEYPEFFSPAMLYSVWLDDPQGSRKQKEQFTSLFQGSRSRTNNGLGSGAIVCLEGSLLHFVEFSRSTGAQNIPRRLPLGGTPIRVFYSGQLNKLVALSVEIEILRPRQSNGHRVQSGRRALRPVITLLNPDLNVQTGQGKDMDMKSHRSEDDENRMEIDSEPVTVAKPESRSTGNAHRLVLGRKPGERFLGIMEWFPKISGNEYHMFVINTMVKNPTRSSTSGRLLLYAVVRRGSARPELALKKSIDLAAPAYSIVAYPNGTSMVFCCGDELCMLSLEEGASGMKWGTPIKTTLRSPARHLSVEAPYIYTSTANESLQVYRLEGQEIVYYCGDQLSRPTLHHINLPDLSLVLASDMTGSITGLWQPPHRRPDSAMMTVFEATLPKAIIRLQRIRCPPWYQATSVDGGRFNHSNVQGWNQGEAKARSGQLVNKHENMIGTSTDGSIVQVDLIDDGWRLLKFVQTLCDRHPRIRPFSFSDPEHQSQAAHKTNSPRLKHINGDILQRMLDRGSERLLREMLEEELPCDEEDARLQEFSTVEERMERFRELASEVVDVDAEGWTGAVIRWIGLVLRSAL